MHIDFDVKFQKIASNTLDTFLPEEKDWLLNEAMLRFIKQRMNRKSNIKQDGFQDTQKRYDDLEELVTRRKLPAYVLVDEDAVFSILPHNYLALINDRSVVLCSSYGVDKDTEPASSFTSNVLFRDDTDNTGGFYSQLKVYVHTNSGTDLVFDISTTPLAGGINLNAKFQLIDMIKTALNGYVGIEAYWEQSGEAYEKSSFIVNTKRTDLVSVEVSVRQTPVVITNVGTFTSDNYISYTDSGNQEVQNRLVKLEDVYRMKTNSFHKPLPSSPLSVLRDTIIQIYQSTLFIVSGINVDYIRIPRKISILLNQSCELAESVHGEVVDIAVKIAASRIMSDNYKGIINDDTLNE